MHIPTFVFIFILFLKNILLLLLYPKHVIKLLGYNLGCYRQRESNNIRLANNTCFIIELGYRITKIGDTEPGCRNKAQRAMEK